MKEVIWIGSSHEDLKDFPQPVRQAMGYALHQVQKGEEHKHVKVLSGMGSAGVQEIRENDKSGTYRTIYTVEMKNYIFVLHAFQKKSKSGISTPKQEMELVQKRLREAKALYKQLTEGGTKK